MDTVELRYLATGGTVSVSGEHADRYVATGKYVRADAIEPEVTVAEVPKPESLDPSGFPDVEPPKTVAPETPVPEMPKAVEEEDFLKLLSEEPPAKPVVHRRSPAR